MPDEMLIARNNEDGSTLPYLIRLPLGPGGVVLKVRETWPRTAKVYCHRMDEWPADAEILERLPVRSISKRGAAIDLVLERGRENRSQFVVTHARGREMIFWQSRRTAKQARPRVTTPTARAHGQVLEIAVDTRERYGYRFSAQQASTVKRKLDVGDYAVFGTSPDGDERLVAAAERKSIEDLTGALLSGKLTYQLAELSTIPRAAVVVESGYSRLFKLEHVSGSVVADAVAETQARFPSVPIIFCETRPLAQEWLYRWFGACLHEDRLAQAPATPLASDEPTSAPAVDRQRKPRSSSPTTTQVREWARANGFEISDRGRIPAHIAQSYAAAHPSGPESAK